VDLSASAALLSWPVHPLSLTLLVLTALVYLRGWMHGRRLLHSNKDFTRLWSFLSGLLALFFALESPLDAFDSLFLSAHMTQHLLLMMIAPPLLLLGQPTLPLLRGLPKAFVKEALGPFLTSHALRKFFEFLTALPVTWLLFALSTILWHMPVLYELALRSGTWHGIQHACFFWTGVLFWWPLVRQGPGKSRWPEWAAIPYLLFSDIVNTALSAFLIFSGKVLYPSYERVHISGFSASDDQALAGAIMWVPGSVVYLIPAIAFTMRLLSGQRLVKEQITLQRAPVRKVRSFNMTKRLPIIRRWAQAVMLLIAIAVIIDGFFGPQLTPINMAGVLPWIHWRALSILALLTIGNLFCMACPFTFVRDIGRKVLPAKLRWPKPLRTKWLPVALLVLYLWTYEAFHLWNSPFLTAWIICGYFGAALLIDGFFRGASFCKYVCPIGQFHFVSSLVSPREVRVRNAATCNSCRTHDCIRGNETASGCELYLFQPKKASSLDCTFCLDCIKACPHDNVALLPVLPAKTVIEDPYRSSLGRLSKRTDFAVLALLIVFGAFVNAAGMIGPVMMWEHRWHARIGAHGMPAAVGIFVMLGAVVIPALSALVCGALNRLVERKLTVMEAARRFSFALVPLGIAMWAAHLLYHFATGWSSAVPVVARALGGTMQTVLPPLVPNWLTPGQILILDAGLLLTLYVAWQIANRYGTRLWNAAAIVLPWVFLSVGLYAVGIWILLQPMEMRGMVH
jgi:cytochrome c oxidase assembly factor CtaG/polyferredoxin